MCGRFTLTAKDLGRVATALGAEIESGLSAAWQPRYNVAPTQLHPIVREEGAHRSLARAAWGLTSSPGPTPHINARAESAATKPTFRRAFEARRCVVPADGFYEWTSGPGKGTRQPVWFHAPDGALLLLAGLWEERAGTLAFTILTTAANDVVAKVHDRMPALLSRARMDEWLARPDAALLAPAASDALVATMVSARVNRVAADDPDCLAPPSGAPQLTLF